MSYDPEETSLPEKFWAGNDYSGDYASFEECLASAGDVREGYWTPFVTLAWIATDGDDQFVAATQLYEVENEANHDHIFSAAAWIVLGNEAGKRFGRTFTEAMSDLREKLETAELNGGIATDARTGDLVQVQRHMWTQWNRAFETHGLELIPGLYDFKWPSDAVRAAFPVDEPEPTSRAQPTESRITLAPALKVEESDAAGIDLKDQEDVGDKGSSPDSELVRPPAPAPTVEPKPDPLIRGKSGPRKKPRLIKRELEKIFKSPHARNMSNMTAGERHAHVVKFWPGGLKIGEEEIGPPVKNTVEKYWTGWKDEDARQWESELYQ